MGLSIFNPDSNQSPEHLTIRSLFEDYLQPQQGELSRKTYLDYLTLIADWERLMHNLPVSQFSRSALLTFRDRLQQELKPDGNSRSIATINKKFRVIGPLIRIAWPADSHNPGGLGLCGYFKLPKALKEPEKLPFVYSRKQVSQLYQHCAELTWPKRYTALTWKTIFVLHYCCGPRTYDLLSLTWDDVDLNYRGGMGSVSFQAMKTSKMQRIPLNPVARDHLQKLKSVSESNYVFPKFQRTNCSTVRRNWKKLAEIVNLPEGCTMEDFRKTCNSAYDEHWPGVGDWILGHKLSGVNAKSYCNPTRKILKAVQRLPLPKAFRA